jgi:DNA repair protein RadD
MSAYELIARQCQIESVDVTFEIVINNKDRHPIFALPTGAGKSLAICMLIDKILSHDPRHNILVLCDRGTILGQDHKDLEDYFGIDIGLYSADLDSHTIEKITVAGIQSIYKKSDLFKRFDFVIVDECDSVNDKSNSMYRSFLSNLDAVYVGTTATPYGLKGGYLHEGENPLFTEICVDYTRGEKYLQLVEEGVLPRIFSRPTSVKFDSTGLKTLAGDFSLKDQSEKFDIDPITRAAMIETAFYGKNFKRWLLFAIDIKHAENIGRILTEMGISNCVVHSKMARDKLEVLEEAKAGKYRAIINVDILTIGYNDPKIDLVGLYFCTKSPRKHVQTSGRLRVDKDTEFKLVLDFGGNFAELGPLNNVKLKSLKKKKNEKSEPMMKTCPECGMYCYMGAKRCENCDFEFPVSVKLKSNSDANAQIIQSVFEKPKEKVEKGFKSWEVVSKVEYERHSKIGSPDSICVKYSCGMLIHKDYVSIEHGGYPSHLARHWIDFRWKGKGKPPRTVNEFLANQDLISKPAEILVDSTGKYKRIADCKF